MARHSRASGHPELNAQLMFPKCNQVSIYVGPVSAGSPLSAQSDHGVCPLMAGFIGVAEKLNLDGHRLDSAAFEFPVPFGAFRE